MVNGMERENMLASSWLRNFPPCGLDGFLLRTGHHPDMLRPFGRRTGEVLSEANKQEIRIHDR